MKVKTRMLAAVVAGLVAASISGVAAQESDSGAAFFEVSIKPGGSPTEGTEGDSGAGWATSMGASNTGIAVDAGDPRASGLLDTTLNSTFFELPDGVMEVGIYSWRLANEEGAWAGGGPFTLVAEGGPPSQVDASMTLIGEGAYQGLVLEFHGEEPDENMQEVWWGVIYPAAAISPEPEAIAAD